MASLSLLTISSHHHDYHSTNSVSIHNSKVIARDTPSRPEQQLSVFKHGTTVTVHDLFGTMPVRVRQRALEVQKSGSAKEIDDLLFKIVPLLLCWPHHVTYVDVFDITAKGPKVASFHTGSITDAVTGQLRLARRLRALLYQASFLDSVSAESFTDVEVSGFGIKINGTVCLEPFPTKQLQFISLGIEPLANNHGANVLYEEVNRAFADSAFGMVEDEYDGGVPDRKENGRTVRVKDLKARRGIDRWPIFAFQITAKDELRKARLEADEVLKGQSPDLSVITDLLRAVAYQWLKKHHFRPKQASSILQQLSTEKEIKGSATSGDDRGPSRSSSSTSGRSSALTAVDRSCRSPFDSWSRVKMGRQLNNCSPQPPRPSSATMPHKRVPLLDAKGKLLRKPFDDLEPSKASDTPSAVHETETGVVEPNLTARDDVIVWVDPISKVTCTVNRRTGFPVDTDTIMDKRITLPPPSRNLEKATSEPVPWLEDLLATWKNPAYAPVEPPIVRVPDPFEHHTTAPPGREGPCSHVQLGDLTESSTIQLQERVSKASIRDAVVIAQVDTKFILVKVTPQTRTVFSSDDHSFSSSGKGELLVLIDQHAADERCRVEELQGAYFIPSDAQPGRMTAATEALDKPLLFETNRQESLLLERFKQHFAHWGITYTVKAHFQNAGGGQTSQTKSKIQIDRLPPSILERCRVEPRVLIELMRREIWRLRDGSDIPTAFHQAESDTGDDNNWVRCFHGCPQGILDLIFSRACRSAIMFNDELSMDQCQDLVLRLSGCVFPFQCAHGRPSMAPVVDLGSWSGFGTALPAERRNGGLMAALRKWKDKVVLPVAPAAVQTSEL